MMEESKAYKDLKFNKSGIAKLKFDNGYGVVVAKNANILSSLFAVTVRHNGELYWEQGKFKMIYFFY